MQVFAVDAEPVVAVEGETVIVEVTIGGADPGDVAAWLLAEARWYAMNLGALLDVELGSDSVKHLVNLHLDDPRPDWAPDWLPEEKKG